LKKSRASIRKANGISKKYTVYSPSGNIDVGTSARGISSIGPITSLIYGTKPSDMD
jgi:hypothetical protein